MSNESESYQVLLQVSGDVSKLTALLGETKKQQDEGFREIREKIFQYAERMIALEHNVADAQKDIANRTHTTETERLRKRIEELELGIKHKADNRLVWWVMSILTGVFGLAIAIAVNMVTGQ